MNSLMQDVRFAWRLMWTKPVFTVAAVLVLALGMGANTTVFNWVNEVLLDPLPGVERSEEIVEIVPMESDGGPSSHSYPDYLDIRERTRTLESVAVSSMSAVALLHNDRAERVWAMIVSGNYFDVLRVKPIVGRTFLPEEDKTKGTHPVVVLSETLWRSHYGADPAIVGRIITLNKVNFTVLGVVPARFRGTYPGLAFSAFVPTMMQPVIEQGFRINDRGMEWMESIARLRPGVTTEQVNAELDAISAQLKQAYPETNRGLNMEVYSIRDSPKGSLPVMKPVMAALMAVVLIVLLIACANVANLLLARGVSRRREIAIRLSLGAPRWRLVRQLMVESLLLAALAAVVAVAIASWTGGLLTAFTPPMDFPVSINPHVDYRVLAFTLALTVLTALLFGLAPALQVSRGSFTSTMKEEGNVTSGRPKVRLRGGLVVLQLSLSLVLLISAGLMARSLTNKQNLDPGFDINNVLLAQVDLFPAGYKDADGQRFFRDAMAKLAALPGVESVTMARRVPMGFGGTTSSSIVVEGYPAKREERVWSYTNWVGPGYFANMRIPLVRGRDFSDSDNAQAPKVAIINETLAKRYFGDSDPIGRTIELNGKHTIIGVSKNILDHLNDRPTPYIHFPVMQWYRPAMTFQVRAANPLAIAPSVEATIRSLDRTLPVYNVRTLREHTSAVTFQQRMSGSLLIVLGIVALLMAAIGMYGVLAFVVGQRTHEIGIRMALGAQQRDVLRMVLRSGLTIALVGIGIGLAAATAVTRLLRALLYHVSPLDPLIFTAAAAVLLGAALLASYVPARRATKVDPMTALRYE